MCNLNILITKKGSYNKYAVLLERLTTLSYDNNSDADGVYFSGTDKVYKSSNKLNYLSYKKDFNTSRFVISHQRLSTSGMGEENHQPLENEHFVFAHNGVFWNYGTEAQSDTKQVFNLWLKTFYATKKKMDKADYETVITATCKAIFEEVTGSFSVFIYDKVNKVGYYIKNDSTSIHLYKTDDYMYLSTRPTSDWHVKGETKIVKPMNLYKVGIRDNEFMFDQIIELEESYDYYGGYGSKSSYSSNSNRTWNRSTPKQTKIDKYAKWEGYCEHCGLFTDCKTRPRFNHMFLCKDCYNDMRQDAYDFPEDFNIEDYGNYQGAEKEYPVEVYDADAIEYRKVPYKDNRDTYYPNREHEVSEMEMLRQMFEGVTVTRDGHEVHIK